MALLGIIAGFWVALASPASAQFEVCNQTLDVANVAVGFTGPDEIFRTEGWWTVGSNTCATVIRDPLATRYIYVFATDVFGQDLIDGTEPMCIGEKKFVIDGFESCWQRGYREVKFLEVDTQATERWQLFLSEPTN